MIYVKYVLIEGIVLWDLWTHRRCPEFSMSNLRIRCLRGVVSLVETVINGLPPSGLASLYKIQLWNMATLPVVPPSFTHVCVYYNQLDEPPL